MTEDYRYQGDWCHAYEWNGQHYNYGWPHVTGWHADLQQQTTNCWFCGKRFTEAEL